MEMYDYAKIIKKLKLDELDNEAKLKKVIKCSTDCYDTLIRFYNYYLTLIEKNDDLDDFDEDIKGIKNSKAKTIKGYLDLIERIVDTTNEIANETIELNTKIHKKEKEIKKNKHSLLKTLFIGSLFGTKKKQSKAKDNESYSYEETELEDDDYHFEDSD